MATSLRLGGDSPRIFVLPADMPIEHRITSRVEMSGVGMAVSTVSNGQLRISGVISGSGAEFIKGGSGTLRLTADNTYSAETIVNSGLLELTGSGAIEGSSLITINDGGTLRLATSGTNTISNAGEITIANGGVLDLQEYGGG